MTACLSVCTVCMALTGTTSYFPCFPIKNILSACQATSQVSELKKRRVFWSLQDCGGEAVGEPVGGEDADRDGLVAVVKVLGLRRLRRETPPDVVTVGRKEAWAR